MPFILITLQQIIFKSLNQILFIALLFTLILATIFLFSLNLMTAQTFKVMGSQKVVFKLFRILKPNTNPRIKLKVSYNLINN